MKQIIYTTELDDYTIEQAKDYLLEFDDNTSPSDNELENIAQTYKDDEFYYLKDDLNRTLDNQIICIANLSLWYGSRLGYKLLDNNLKSILNVIDGDNFELYLNSYDLKMNDHHHDGINTYTFRKIKDNINIDTFLNKIYNNDLKKGDISKYTKSLKKDIKKLLDL